MNLPNRGIYLKKEPENSKTARGRKDAKTFVSKCEGIVTNPPTTRKEALESLDELRKAEISAFFRNILTFGAYYCGWQNTIEPFKNQIRSAYQTLSKITGIDLGIRPDTNSEKPYGATIH